jgi:peptide-methionine (R)-S-oxide reductase
MSKAKITLVILVTISLPAFSCAASQRHGTEKISMDNTQENTMKYEVTKTETEGKEILSPEAYHVLREKGTERAFTGTYYHHSKKGVYLCGACGNPLFDSKAKYDSGSGWPSFYEPVAGAHIETASDPSAGMMRTEVRCARCGSHLGHVFEDGPAPTGLRYCINSIALDFTEE